MFCTSCGAGVSGRYCASCGAPAGAPIAVSNPRRGKNAQLLGQSLAIMGAFGLVWSLSGEYPHAAIGMLSLLVLAAGMLVWAAGKTAHWYHAE